MSSKTTKGKTSTSLSGSNADDSLVGTTAAERVDAKAGTDSAVGGAGNDWVKGGSGNDEVDGGAGNDQVDGGAGNDRLVYDVDTNLGASDSYDGGSGTNTLVLKMSRAQWMRDDVQADLAAFLAFLGSDAANATGLMNSKGYTFTSLGLQVRRVAGIDVLVDGVAQDPRDEAVLASNDAVTTATEHDILVGNVVDNDKVPDLVRAVELVSGPQQGELQLDSAGSYRYDPGMAFDHLAVGESADVSFTYRVTDADRDSATAQVTFTITGTNDAPIAVDDNGSTDENSVLTIDALANDTDVDTSDTHTIAQAALVSGLGSVAIVDNQLRWTPGTDYDYLAVGESATVEIDYTVSDNHGATDVARLTLTVNGSNDAPVAADDSGSTDENAVLTIDALANDTDVDTSDTHTIAQAAIVSGLGSVAIVDNQLRWTPGTDYDYLAVGESATVEIDYTVSDNHSATDAARLTLTVNGSNDTPVVLESLAAAVSEQDPELSLDLLVGASDVDNGAVLNVANLVETTGLGGWTLDGNQLQFNPDHFDDLNTGDLAELQFSYQVVDEHGAAVTQTLKLDVEGFTDAPALAVVASAGAQVNHVTLTITTQPVKDERVALAFAGLPVGARILNAALQDVSSGVFSTTGSEIFTLVLPPHLSHDADFEIIVTGKRPDNSDIASRSGLLDIVYDHRSDSEDITFSASNQGIWASGDAPRVEWHEYIPLVGNVTRTWDANAETWIDNNAAPWSTGAVKLFSAGVTAADAIDIALAVPRSILDAAQAVFDGIDGAARATYNWAVGVYQDGVRFANETYTEAVRIARVIYDNTVGPAAAFATQAAYDIYNAAVKVAADIRDAALVVDFLDWFTGAIWDTYYFAEGLARGTLNIALGAIEGVEAAARDTFNLAVEAARILKDGAIIVAGETLNAARIAYEVIRDPAQGVLNLAKDAYNAVANELNKVTGETKLEVTADLYADVGVQVDFVLDSGSVDAEVNYVLTSVQQHNQTTDMLAILPQLTNTSTGEAVAFDTISPNAQLRAALLYDVGAKLNVFLDSTLAVSGQVIWDISGADNGINIPTEVTTGGWGPAFEDFKSLIMLLSDSDDPDLSEVKVGELLLIDVDTTELEQFEVPFIGTLTEDIVSVELGFPTIATEGKADAYDPAFFAEGGLVGLDITEITQSILNLVNARLDWSPELRALVPDLVSLYDNDSLGDVVQQVGLVFLSTLFEALDGQSEATPIFLIDATDETSTELLHANLFPDFVIGDTLAADTATFGFWTAYGESNDLVKVTIDIDQAVAVIVNKIIEAAAAAGTSGATVQFLQALPDINPLDLEFGLAEILAAIEAPQSTIDEITEFFDLSVGFEAADVDVYSSLKFSQEFSLSIDDMLYEVTMEDATIYEFAANQQGSLLIADASSHDADQDGVVEYTMKLVPKAMFSNDTEIGLAIGYVLDFLQASLTADLVMPGLDDLLDIEIPGLPEIKFNLADVNLGPLLRVQGDLDLASADIFESRFEFDLDAVEVTGGAAMTDQTLVTVIGVPPDSLAA